MTIYSVTYKPHTLITSSLRNGKCNTKGIEILSTDQEVVLSSIGERGSHSGHIGLPTDSDTLYQIAQAFMNLSFDAREKELKSNGLASNDIWAENACTVAGEIEIDGKAKVSTSTVGAYISSWLYVEQCEVVPPSLYVYSETLEENNNRVMLNARFATIDSVDEAAEELAACEVNSWGDDIIHACANAKTYIDKKIPLGTEVYLSFFDPNKDTYLVRLTDSQDMSQCGIYAVSFPLHPNGAHSLQLIKDSVAAYLGLEQQSLQSVEIYDEYGAPASFDTPDMYKKVEVSLPAISVRKLDEKFSIAA